MLQVLWPSYDDDVQIGDASAHTELHELLT